MSLSEQLIKHISENPISVPQIPNDFIVRGLKSLPENLVFTTAQLYEEYLISEQAFWKEYEQHPFFSQYFAKVNVAISHFNTANTRQQWDFASYLTNSTNALLGVPSSKTILAQGLVNLKDESQNFINGYLDGIRNTDIAMPNRIQKDYYLGFRRGLEYMGYIKKMHSVSKKEKETFDNIHAMVTNKKNAVVKELEDLGTEKKTEVETFKKDIADFKGNITSEFATLKKVYEEDLRLKKPAEYWTKMSKRYSIWGFVYMGLGMLVGALSIWLVFHMISLMARGLNEYSEWFNYFHLTASFAVVTAIAVYLIRIFVKLSMSSHHLARDAREREQLTYFYLSLMNEGAVESSERELVLKALFSRSNTGLVKGDDAPEMPNFADILKSSKK
ncbi:MAG: DUF6161 domain-containing protein [Firmicutes bacterium]|nr:DUF6161 domain-containing protein [Bacillota bacterium]